MLAGESRSNEETLAHRMRRLIDASGPDHLVKLRRTEYLYRCGDDDRCVYVIRHGSIETLLTGGDGKPYQVGTFGADDVFGESSLCGSGQRAESAVAVQDSVVERVPVALILAQCDDPAFTMLLIRHIAVRLSEQGSIAAEWLAMNAEQRLARTLVRLARHAGEATAEGLRVTPRLTRREMARMIVTTRCRVGLFLNHFIALGMIRPCGVGLYCIKEASLLEFARGNAVKSEAGQLSARCSSASARGFRPHASVSALGHARGQAGRDVLEALTECPATGHGRGQPPRDATAGIDRLPATPLAHVRRRPGGVPDALSVHPRLRLALSELTRRQRQVLVMIAEGKSSKHMAEELGLSVKTVARHRSDLMAKLDRHSVGALIQFAHEAGLLPSASLN